ncbi:MAG: hypothetical protein QOH87_4676, partial [Trebonia sp.]|nr:hypothetical protein [Trebonia sp.]
NPDWVAPAAYLQVTCESKTNF